MNKTRAVLRLIKDDKFEHVEMSDLCDGDYFKMFEPLGEPVTDINGNTLFKVVGYPSKREDGVWQVHIEQK